MFFFNIAKKRGKQIKQQILRLQFFRFLVEHVSKIEKFSFFQFQFLTSKTRHFGREKSWWNFGITHLPNSRYRQKEKATQHLPYANTKQLLQNRNDVA